MMQEEDRRLDLELLVFYLFVSVLSFFLYFIRHPFFYFITDPAINWTAVFSAYWIDLVIFAGVFLPYLIIVIILAAAKLFRKIKISDDIMIILFFPLLSFFMKGMTLFKVYTSKNMLDIVKDNFAFFAFLFIGPVILFVHGLIVRSPGAGKKDNIRA
jgi:hypothetical protein